MADPEAPSNPNEPNSEPDNALSGDELAYMQNRGEVPDPAAVSSPAAEPAAPATPVAEAVPVAAEPPPAAPVEPPVAEPLSPLAAQLAQVMQELKPLNDAVRAANQPPSPVIPAFETHPAEHLKYQQDQLAAQQAEINRREQARGAQSQLLNAYQADAQAFSGKTADFSDAYRFMLAQRTAELAAAGFSPEQAAQNLAADELTIVQKAFQDRVSPASRIYAMAKARGYAAKPAPAAPNAPNAAAAATVATLQAAPAAANAIRGPGGEARQDLTVESLDSMTDEELMKLDYRKFKAAMGG